MFKIATLGPPTLSLILALSVSSAVAQTPEQEPEAVPEDAATAPTPVEASSDEGSADNEGSGTNKEDSSPEVDEPPTVAEEPATPPEDDASPAEPTTPDATQAPPASEEPVPVAPKDDETQSPPGWPLKASASFWSRFEWRENYDHLGVSRPRFFEGDQTVYRARFGFRTAPIKLTDSLEGLVQFTPQASGAYGVDGTVQEHNLGIYEGYFQVQGKMASVQAGRFRMDYGDALVIGDLGWHQTARAFDGVRAQLHLGQANLDVFVTQTNATGTPGAEGHPLLSGPIFAGDYYFYGLYAKLGPLLDDNFDWDLYLLGNSNVETDNVPNPADPTAAPVTIDGATLGTLGTRVKHTVGILDYRFEGGLQIGEKPAVDDSVSTLAYQIDGELGVKPVSKLRIALAGALASGDDPTTEDFEGWTPLYATHHKWFGLMDVVGLRTNIGSGTLKLAYSATDSLTAKIDAHVFARPRHGGLAQVGSDKLAGYEIDTQLVQKIGKPVTVRGLYGIFLPNDGYYASDEAAHYVELQGGLDF